LYATIVTGGLALGITTLLVITQWTAWHTGFDRHFSGIENTYRVSLLEKGDNFERSTARIIHGDVVHQLYTQAEIPEIGTIGRLAPYRNAIVRNSDIAFYEDNCFSCDPEFISIFKPKMIIGDQKTALDGPFKAIISEKTARKYFGNEEPTGKQIEIVHQFDTEPHQYEITGVYRDFPENSHFKINLLTSFENPETYNSTAWVYLHLQKGADPDKVGAQIKDLIVAHNDERYSKDVEPSIIPVTDIHLKSHLARELERNVKGHSLLVLFTAGLLVFILAWFNFTLLSISQNQLNLNKLIYQWQFGAGKRNFFYQFFVDFFTISMLSFIIGIALSILISNPIKNTIGISITQNSEVLLLSLLFIFLILAGSSALTSAFATQRLYKVLQEKYFIKQKSTNKPVHSRNWFIRTVIILEFIITFGLITNLLMISTQVNYSIQNQIGSNDATTLQLSDLPRPVIAKYEAFRNELKKHASIEEVTAMMEKPGGMAMDAFNYKIEGLPENNDKIYVFPVDENFIQFYDLNILAGKDFPDDYDTNDTTAFYILNETAVRVYEETDHEDMIGRELSISYSYPGYMEPGKIIGVVEDFHLSDMGREVTPMVIFPEYVWLYCFSIRLNGDVEEGLKILQREWLKFFPEYPFRYNFTTDIYRTLYATEHAELKVFLIFSLLSVIIAGTGLFALSGFFMQQKMHAAAIRKINGAALKHIFLPDLLQYMVLALISSIIAIPFSWYTINSWKENFVYQIPLPIWLFPATALFLIIFSWIAVIYHTIKLTRINPIIFIRNR
jgi:putative ABC transport system permease protein